MVNKIKNYLILFGCLIILGLLLIINYLSNKNRDLEIQTIKKVIDNKKEKIKESKTETQKAEKKVKEIQQETVDKLKILQGKKEKLDKALQQIEGDDNEKEDMSADDARKFLDDFLDRTDSPGQ